MQSVPRLPGAKRPSCELAPLIFHTIALVASEGRSSAKGGRRGERRWAADGLKRLRSATGSQDHLG